jgi:3-hydroxyacyl-[acyl-carrier-protein] dehydratase
VRFFLFDRIVFAKRSNRLQAIKLVDLMDESFSDHFPLKATMPSTLIIEALAQAGGMLNALNHDFAAEMVLMLVDGVRIYRQVYQGELLSLVVSMQYEHPYGATLQGEAYVGDELIAKIERIAFAHEIVDDPERIKTNRERFRYQSGGFTLIEEVTE